MRVGRAVVVAMASALAGYIAWDRIEVYRFHRDVSEIAARGEPVDVASLDRSPSNAEEQEAAQLYAAAAARARDMLDRDSGFTRVDVDAIVGAVNVTEIEETFRNDAPALQLLDRATPLPFNGFGDATDGPEWTVSTGVQSLNLLACLRSDLLAYRGDGEAATASLVAAVRLQRTVPDMATRSFLSARQLGSLRILLRHAAPTDGSLAALQKSVAELPDDDMMQHDLLALRARVIDAQGTPLAQPGLPAVAVFAFHPFLVRMQRVQLEQFPPVMLAARAPWPDRLGALAALANSPANRTGRTPLSRALFGPPLNIAALAAGPAPSATRLALRRLMLTTIGLERYRRAHGGAPPADLASLVPAFLPALPMDPFSGKPLVYRVSDASYLVYSADVNGKDDGGQLYGVGSQSTTSNMRTRDLGIRVPLTPRRGAQ